MRRRKNKKIIIVILILFISIGFAYLSASLNITGLATIKRSVWDVHFENIVNENEDVLNIDTPAVISNNKLRVDFEVSLDQPGQEYSFYVDVLNNSTFDVALSNLNITGLDSSLENYIIPTVTYSDGITPLPNDILKENSLETLRVSVKYNDDLDANNLPTIDSDFQLSVQLTYIQADSNSKERNHLEYINRQTPGAISVGDEIAIDTEHFYVVSSDEDKTVLLAKYNLNVGAYTVDGELGIQNENAKGYTIESEPRSSTIAFSNISYFSNGDGSLKNEYGSSYDHNNVYDSEKGIATKEVKKYRLYLEELGLRILKERLITFDELIDLGCQYTASSSTGSCNSVSQEKNFINTNSYWTATASNSDGVKVVRNGSIYNNAIVSNTYNGVRPVIEIQSKYLEENVIVSFDPNGGEVAQRSKLVSMGSTYEDLPTPTRDGYTFLGWNGYNPVSPVIIGKCISSVNGEDQIKNTCGSTDYIEVDFEKNSIYTVSGLTDKLWSFVAYYDENYVPLGRSAGSSRTSLRLNNVYSTTFNEGGPAKYIRITQYEISGATVDPIDIVSDARILLNPGNYALPYEPYYITNDTTVVQDKSHTLKAIWQEN